MIRLLILSGYFLALCAVNSHFAIAQYQAMNKIIPLRNTAVSADTAAFNKAENEPLEECTIGAASGKATKDGRPMIWKTRDASTGDNAVYLNTTYRYKFLAVIDAGSRKSTWMALTETGFAILNSVAYDLSAGSSGMGNGTLMTFAAGTCASVAEFKHLLDSTNITKRSTAANFVVMDSTGAAAIFETGGNQYWKFDAQDSLAYPKGYVLRTNFTFTGGGVVGLARFNRTTDLFKNFSVGDSITPKSILRYQMRDFADSTGVPYAIPFHGTVGGAPIGYIPIQETICRLSSVSATVIQGVLPKELARTSTFWVILGCPATGIAVPYWPVGEPPLNSADLPKSALNNISNDIFTKISGGTLWSNYINTQLLRDNNGGGLLRNLFQTEDGIFAAADTLLIGWRKGQYTAATMLKAESTYAALALNGLITAKNNITGVFSAATLAAPSGFSLSQNYPNPFNSSTVIRFSVAERGMVTLAVYDLLGRKVETLINEEHAPGPYMAYWNAEGKASGVYFLMLRAGSSMITKRMVLQK